MSKSSFAGEGESGALLPAFVAEKGSGSILVFACAPRASCFGGVDERRGAGDGEGEGVLAAELEERPKDQEEKTLAMGVGDGLVVGALSAAEAAVDGVGGRLCPCPGGEDVPGPGSPWEVEAEVDAREDSLAPLPRRGTDKRDVRCEMNDPILEPHEPIAARASAATRGTCGGVAVAPAPSERGRRPP